MYVVFCIVQHLPLMFHAVSVHRAPCTHITKWSLQIFNKRTMLVKLNPNLNVRKDELSACINWQLNIYAICWTMEKWLNVLEHKLNVSILKLFYFWDFEIVRCYLFLFVLPNSCYIFVGFYKHFKRKMCQK